MAKAAELYAVNPTGTIGDNISLMLHIRLGELLHYERHIADVARVAELHAMRIAAKRLRYTMELFLPYVDGAEQKTLAGLLDKTKRIQEQIGEIHDRDVRVPLIAKFARDEGRDKPEIRSGLLRLAQKEAEERSRIYRQFLQYWTEQRGRYIERAMTLIGSLGATAAQARDIPGGALSGRLELSGDEASD